MHIEHHRRIFKPFWNSLQQFRPIDTLSGVMRRFINMKIANIFATAICVILLISGCSDKRQKNDIDIADFGHIAATAILNPDQNIIDSLINAANNHSHQFAALTSVMGLDTTGNDISAWLNAPAVKAFAEAVDSYAPSAEDIQAAINYTVNSANEFSFDLPAKEYATAIWGKPQSILFADSVMLIALNHYLGSSHPAYSSLPAYLRNRKAPQVMKYDIAESLVATAYPFAQEESNTVANRMMYEGALVMAKMILVDNATEAAALGYTQEELDWLKDNEAGMWSKMLGAKMVFDGSEMLADKLFAPSPATVILSADAPGRAGRYFGYQLIKAYMSAHPDISLRDYLADKKYLGENPLVGIRYNP